MSSEARSDAGGMASTSRWTGNEMQKRVSRRYRAERRFRMFGFAAIGVSVAFLAFLLFTMAWKGLGGFTQTEARLTVDFARSDLFLEEATLRGPEAREAVASAGLEGVIEQDQHCVHATAIPRAVVVLDCEHEQVCCLCEEQSRLAPQDPAAHGSHGPPLGQRRLSDSPATMQSRTGPRNAMIRSPIVSNSAGGGTSTAPAAR